jgi:hypothetical protein
MPEGFNTNFPGQCVQGLKLYIYNPEVFQTLCESTFAAMTFTASIAHCVTKSCFHTY